VNTPAARRLPRFGAVALACYVVHAGFHISEGRPQDVLWACHVAALSIALGCFLGNASFIAVGILWLSYGNPLWLVDITTGGELLPTSILTHVGGLLVGLFALRKLGWPGAVWGRAALAFLGLLGLTRLLTPRKANVNLAFRVADGWESTFPNFAVYFALLAACAALTFFLAELGWRRILS
jgi:hypothetical protein